MKPSLIAKATGGKVTPRKAIPVAIKFGGTVDDPKITGIDVGALAKTLAEEFALAAGAGKLLACSYPDSRSTI